MLNHVTREIRDHTVADIRQAKRTNYSLFVTDVSFKKIHIYEHGYNHIIEQDKTKKRR
jgi:hypothetical protein